jgi:hypothetical protein
VLRGAAAAALMMMALIIIIISGDGVIIIIIIVIMRCCWGHCLMLAVDVSCIRERCFWRCLCYHGHKFLPLVVNNGRSSKGLAC